MNFEAPGDISFTSSLRTEWTSALEDLLFFNENQSPYRDVVVESIERFGEPMLKVDRGLVRLHTRSLGEVQALFAIEKGAEGHRPIAAAIYARTKPETVTLLHIVVRPEFGALGRFANEMVTLRLLRQVLEAVSRIKGIDQLEMLYGGTGRSGDTIPIRSGRGRQR